LVVWLHAVDGAKLVVRPAQAAMSATVRGISSIP
jgi:hypothetical protein